MSDPRWRVGQKLGRTLYRGGVCVGMVNTKGLAGEIVAAMNGAAPNDREAIAQALSREASRIFNRQARAFPSNVLDIVALNLRAGATEKLSEPPEGWPKNGVRDERDHEMLLRAAVSFHFQGHSGLVGDYVMVDYYDEDDEWIVTPHKPGLKLSEQQSVPFKTQAEALDEARRLTAVSP